MDGRKKENSRASTKLTGHLFMSQDSRASSVMAAFASVHSCQHHILLISLKELRAWDEAFLLWKDSLGPKPELPITADVWMYRGELGAS